MKISRILCFALIFATLLCLPASADGSPYTDVGEDSWCYDAVCRMRDTGMMLGTGSSTFSPDAVTTRGMLVTILYRYAGSPETGVKGHELFGDVGNGSYCDMAVGWANENGIALGYTDKEFRPNQKVTRQQLVTFLYRYAMTEGAFPVPVYTVGYMSDDWNEVEGYAKEPMIWAATCGVLMGTSDDTYSPNGSANRAQTAVFMSRFIDEQARLRVRSFHPGELICCMSAAHSERFRTCAAELSACEADDLDFEADAEITVGSITYFFEFEAFTPDISDYVLSLTKCGYIDAGSGSCGMLTAEDAELEAELESLLWLYCIAAFESN